jgi:hypothetical protein
VADCNIVPCAEYTIQAITDLCPTTLEISYSPPLLLKTTTTWGDVVGTFVGAPTNRYQPANNVVNVGDITALVQRFGNLAVAPPRTWCDLDPNQPTQGVNLNITVGDMVRVVDAFGGRNYPFSGPKAPDPCLTAE